MSKSSESGLASSALIIVLLALVLVGSLAFGFWAFSGRQDYKNKADVKIAAAVKAAKEAQATELQKQFDEQSKSPTKSYQGPVTSGSIAFSYPKTWSAYIDEGTNNQQVNAYFHPDKVPGFNTKSAYALRVEMLNTDYSQVVNTLSKQNKEGGLKASAYIPPKMVGVTNVQAGTRFDGPIASDKTGAIVVIKVRDKTLKIYTESTDYLNDFDNIILPSLTYLP